MTFEEIMLFLEANGSEQYRKIYTNHGIPDPKFGVKISELKKLVKKIKKNYELSKQLYDTGNYDAMYLAGLVADESKMTKEDLEHWMSESKCEGIACNTVAWIAAESSYGLELAKEWMTLNHETTAAAGWATYTSLITLKPNEDLNIPEIESNLDTILGVIHSEREEVKYQMNYHVIAIGGYIPALRDKAKDYGEQIGKVSVDMGNTACKVALIKPYIEKMEARGIKKKKQARC